MISIFKYNLQRRLHYFLAIQLAKLNFDDQHLRKDKELNIKILIIKSIALTMSTSIALTRSQHSMINIIRVCNCSEIIVVV